MQHLDRKRDALTAADAQSDQAALETVPAHRVNELRRQHGSGRADRVAVRDGAAIDIDDLVGQSELARDDDGDRRERLIDLGPLDRVDVPSGALQRLLDGWHGPQTKHAGLDRRNAVGDEPRDLLKIALLGPGSVREHHGRRRVVEARRIAGGDRAVWAKRGLQSRQRLDRGVGTIGFVLMEGRRPLFARNLHRRDLRLEMPSALRPREALLRAQSPLVLLLARDLIFLNQILSMPARMLAGEGVVEAVAKYAVVELSISEAIAPSTTADEIRSLIHALHAASDRGIGGAQQDFLRR